MKRVLGILFLLLMLLLVGLSSTEKEREEEEPQEIIDTIDLLTDEDFEKLYSCKQDIRKEDPNIVELSQADAWLLMQIARSEAGNDQEAQQWVMRVILNRLESGEFGDSIYDVVSATGQFEVFSSGAYKTADLEPSSHYALAQIESGWNETDNALYFEASSNSSNSWHCQNRVLVGEIEGQRYYK